MTIPIPKIVAALHYLFPTQGYFPKMSHSYCLYRDFESDFVAVSRYGVITEVEIKTSRADYLADFKKSAPIRSRNIPGQRVYIPKHETIASGSGPGRFYFCVPAGLVSHEEVPAHAGLIEVKLVERRTGGPIHIATITKGATRLHKQKASDDQVLKILTAAAYRYIRREEEQLIYDWVKQ